jgi:hypothetical protein
MVTCGFIELADRDREGAMRRFFRVGGAWGGIVVACLLSLGALAAETAPQGPPKAPSKTAKKKQAKPTLDELRRLVAEQSALIAEQQGKIAEQQATMEEQQGKIEAQAGEIETQKTKLAEMEEGLLAMARRLDELQRQIPGAQEQQALAERLRLVEAAAAKEPELPPTVVSAGDFPGSIRIPSSDAAIKFGGRIRTAAVFTLGPLGSEDRFLTNSIPVTEEDEAAGKGKRTSFSANTSRLNFEMRTPTGVGQMRAFLEGDFYGSTGVEEEKRTAFRLRHAYAQFRGALVGQTWSTFSDPAANHQDLDFEGINGENVIRQPQFRYTWQVRQGLEVAAAAETPQVSLTDGKGVNLIPDLVGRAVWKFKETGHLQGAVVLREIRGESDAAPGIVKSVFAWGASLSGVRPFQYFHLTDRFIFQFSFGKGNARYINDLNSLGGQDAVFDLATGNLEAIPATGWYLDYEHQWKEWESTRVMKLRSSVIWSFVTVNNLDFQKDDAYRTTNRLSVNLVFSPIERIDAGIEYVYGTRDNKNGERGSSDQIQIVGIFRF